MGNVATEFEAGRVVIVGNEMELLNFACAPGQLQLGAIRFDPDVCSAAFENPDRRAAHQKPDRV